MRTLPHPGRDGSGTTAGTKVLYVIGWGRSGSTILDNLLGELDGFFSVGELTYFWERGLIEERRCGCGEPLRRCPVWSRVLEEALGDPASPQVDPHDALRWQREAVRVRHTWKLLRQPPGAASGDGALDSYTKATLRIYRAVADVTGARVIVDSSKRPSDGALLRLLPGVVPFYVHLVRDPRAVAYSWNRPKKQLDRDDPADMKGHSPARSTLSWLGWNLAAEALRRRHPREQSLLVRYEDFVAQPRKTLETIAEFVGEHPARFPIEGARTALLAPNHTVSGNPSRFLTGKVELREDTDWLTRQSPVDRLLVTGVAAPLLRRYAYGFVPRRKAP
jgi:hypothetical protein